MAFMVGDELCGNGVSVDSEVRGRVGWINNFTGHFRFSYDHYDARRLLSNYRSVSDLPSPHVMMSELIREQEVEPKITPLGDPYGTQILHTETELEEAVGAQRQAASQATSTRILYSAEDLKAFNAGLPPPDMVTLPNHYGRHSIEPIRFAVENFGPGFLIGNAVKYLSRYDAKNGHEDLAKAARYVEMLRLYEAGDPDWYAPAHEFELPVSKDAPLRSKPSHG